MSDAVYRILKYIRARHEKPIKMLDDQIHAVHVGTEFEGVLNLSDLQSAMYELAGESEARRKAESSVREHNDMCDKACAARRPKDGQVTSCGYQNADGSLIYGQRRCPDCPLDWKIAP